MASNGHSRVLIIDDDSDITSFIATVLRSAGHHPVITASVEDALDGFDAMKYNLVITDIFMQGMGGIKGITEIRKRNPGVKIIAMSGGFSGMAKEETLNAARKIGADAIMAKPLSPETINQLVSRMLD